MTTALEFTVVIDDEQSLEIAVAAPSVDVSLFTEPFTVITVDGPPGRAGQTGAPGTGAKASEIPTGTKDGANKVFTLTQPYNSGTTSVYRNGLREMLGFGYDETPPQSITFSEAPLADDDLLVDYWIG